MTNLTCRAGCRIERLTFPPVFRARDNDGRKRQFPRFWPAIARKWWSRAIVVTGMADSAEVPDGTPVIVSDGGVAELASHHGPKLPHLSSRSETW
jgi:hypothetical protein